MSQDRSELTHVAPPSYRGGRTTVHQGYVFEFAPDHPACNQWGYVAQHKLVAEDKVGRRLLPGEIVHHRDDNPQNNEQSNLQVMTRREHAILHRTGRRKYALTEDAVREALQESGGLKKACRQLETTPDTLRRHYPELLRPYVRKSPTRIDDPAIVTLIRQLAPDSGTGYGDIARRYGISTSTVKRLCDRHGIEWHAKHRARESYSGRHRTSASPLA